LMNFIIDEDTLGNYVAYVDPSGAWTPITGYSYSDDRWFHMRFEWDCTSDTWNLWLDGVEYLTDEPFESSRTDTAVDWMMFSSFEGGNAGLYYVDAVGFSWDTNYNVGDNWNEGLLLSFKNSTNLDWKGYSLDEQTNKTILGNTTIPMPSEGLHTIQVFGNDTSGTIEQSELRYFTIDMLPNIPAHYIYLTPNQINTKSQDGVYVEFSSTEIAYLELIRQETNLASKQPGSQFQAYYFYNITIFNETLEKDNSIIGSMKVRFYYDTAQVKNVNKLDILHYLFDIDQEIWVWEALGAELNMEEGYLEVEITELSVFCMAEIKGDTGDPFLLFLINNMLWIIILAAVGVSAPTIYVVRSKKQKKKEQIADKLTQKKLSQLKEKAETKKEALERRMWTPSDKVEPRKVEASRVKSFQQVPVKKKRKMEKLVPAISHEEKKQYEQELEKTEKELILEKKIDTCQVHKGKIEGISYVCPNCQAKYCLKCAKTLKRRAEGCWVCDTAINIELEEGIRFPEMQVEEEGLASIKNAYIDNNLLLKRIRRDEEDDNMAIFRGLNLTTISQDLLNKIGQIEMDDEDKNEFIKEMLALPPEEREEFVDEVIEKVKEFKAK